MQGATIVLKINLVQQCRLLFFCPKHPEWLEEVSSFEVDCPIYLVDCKCDI